MMLYLSLCCIYPCVFSGNFEYQQMNNELSDKEHLWNTCLDRNIYYEINRNEV